MDISSFHKEAERITKQSYGTRFIARFKFPENYFETTPMNALKTYRDHFSETLLDSIEILTYVDDGLLLHIDERDIGLFRVNINSFLEFIYDFVDEYNISLLKNVSSLPKDSWMVSRGASLEGFV